MALETWLIKVKTVISNSFDHPVLKPNIKAVLLKKSHVGVLSFEISSLMSKLLHLSHILSDKNMIRLRNESISLEGVRKIVSNDDSFLLGLAFAELAENLRLISTAVSRISKRCEDSNLRCFDRFFDEFSNTGFDRHNWVLSPKEIESKNKRMDRYVTVTANLHREMDELTLLENSLKKLYQSKELQDQASVKEQKIVALQQKIGLQKQEVKFLKDRSIWGRSFDTVTSLLVRSVFTTLARMKIVFGIGQGHGGHGYPSSLPRCLSANSATVYPSDHQNTTTSTIACSFVSVPLRKFNKQDDDDDKKMGKNLGFFESNSKMLNPPLTTLGAAALALHYANLIIVMEKMIRAPQLVGIDARDDIYNMLPNSIRSSLRSRLKGVGFCAGDPVLAGEWREALGRILGWLSPLAHNMIKWQSERSFEQQNNLVPKTNVLLLQTLFFANKDKTEAAITELLVGLNYIWRFEREMNAKALFECSNFNGFSNNLENSSTQ